MSQTMEMKGRAQTVKGMMEADLEVMAVEPQMMMDQEVEDLEPAPMEVAPRDQNSAGSLSMCCLTRMA